MAEEAKEYLILLSKEGEEIKCDKRMSEMSELVQNTLEGICSSELVQF
jgi:hypothetical protein